MKAAIRYKPEWRLTELAEEYLRPIETYLWAEVEKHRVRMWRDRVWARLRPVLLILLSPMRHVGSRRASGLGW